MAQPTDAKDGGAIQQPPPLRLSRVFHAPRETVFKAWSSADHVKRWFAPATYTAPDARVQMHVGGPFEVCMRSPGGQEHWTRGVFVEVTPHTRLVIDMHAVDAAGVHPLLLAIGSDCGRRRRHGDGHQRVGDGEDRRSRNRARRCRDGRGGSRCDSGCQSLCAQRIADGGDEWSRRRPCHRRSDHTCAVVGIGPSCRE